MAGKKMITDYAGEYEDCIEVLKEELPEYDKNKPKLIKPKITEPTQFNVFGEQEPWFDINEHWKGMPEYESKALKGVRQITVNFSSEEDFLDFQKKIGQTIPGGVKTICHPEREQSENILNAWLDESDD